MKRSERRARPRRLLFAALIAFAPGFAAAQLPNLDPRSLERLQSQLGSGAEPVSSSERLDDAREAAARGLDRRDEPTEEELAVRRERSRRELEELVPASAIEREYQQRTGDQSLRQFGYDLFRGGARTPGPLTGALGGDYVLGVGDELVVSFQGATNSSRTARVDREGRVVVGQLPPIRAAGRSLGSVRAELAAATRRTLLGTSVDVSVGSVRAITVFVGGEVVAPGQYQLTSLADISAALAQAGGIRRSGSLRRVRVVRAGATREVDLYGLLGIGAPPSVRLREGDRIIVPVIGPTVAVAGQVARPAIYELRGRVTADEAVAYAGGALRPRGARIAISRIGPDGSEEFVRATAPGTPVLAGDAVLLAGGSAGGALGRVELRGFVLNPGPRPLALAPTVRELAGDLADLRAGTYLPMAILIRRDPATGARRFVPIDLVAALGGAQPVALRSEDRLYVLSQTQVDFINRATVRRIVLGQPNPVNGCRPLDRLAELVGDTQSQRYAAVTRGTFTTRGGDVAAVGGTLAQRGGAATDTRVRSAQDDRAREAALFDDTARDPAALDDLRQQDTTRQTRTLDESDYDSPRARAERLERQRDFICPEIFREEPELLPVLIENAVSVGGAVRRPGAYPVAGPIAAARLEALAEGVLGQSTEVVLDVTQAAGASAVQRRYGTRPGAPLPAVTLRPGDDIRFNAAQAQFEQGAVLLTGEVGRPGLFTIKKGERLSELLTRAGGITPLGYPYGAVFTRRAVREAQQEGFRRTARELNESLIALAARRTEGSPDSLLAASQFVNNLASAEAQGRVVIEADPRVLKLRPDLDTVLEAGDTLFIPKLPTYIVALGDVANPGALQFVPGKRVGEYLRESGGFRRQADDERAFVVLPNGAAQPMRMSFFRRASFSPPPGSTIIVPKNVDPLYTLDVARDIATIIGQFVSSVATAALVATR